jgi:serine protease Do
MTLIVMFGIWCLKFEICPAQAQDWWPFGKKKTEVTVNHAAVARDPRVTTSYAPVVQLVAPSVVTIKAKRHVQPGDPTAGRQWPPFPGADDDRQLPRGGQGSGVIVTGDGYILTNNHVVAGQDRLQVNLPDRDTDYEAKLIGADAKSDLAVLKINARDLPAATLGDSGQLAVGDVVLAIGNPFDLGQTVTVGIVSGLGRNDARILGHGSYANFIQTDAAINSGNSGGPLVDTAGRVIGINTAILSPHGGNLGIGFAIPVNLARFIMAQLITHGKVTRGYLGVQIQNLDAELAASYGRDPGQGVLVTKVEAGAAAEKAKLQRGDLITAVNDEPARDAQTLRLAISSLPPGTALKITYFRHGRAAVTTVTLGQLPADPAADDPDHPADGDADAEGAGALLKGLGLDIRAIPPELRRNLNLRDNLGGVLITKVDPNSAAADKGCRRGAVILEINDQPVATVKEAVEAVRQSKATVRLYLWDNGFTHYLALKKD